MASKKLETRFCGFAAALPPPATKHNYFRVKRELNLQRLLLQAQKAALFAVGRFLRPPIGRSFAPASSCGELKLAREFNTFGARRPQQVDFRPPQTLFSSFFSSRAFIEQSIIDCLSSAPSSDTLRRKFDELHATDWLFLARLYIARAKTAHPAKS